MPALSVTRAPRLAHRVRRVPLEAVIWSAGLVALALTDPNSEGWLNLCVFRWMGVDHCPGCGLGHAIAFLFRLDFAASIHAHPLGIPALIILVSHVVRLVRNALRQPLNPPL